MSNIPYRECACGNQIMVGGTYLCDACRAADRIYQILEREFSGSVHSWPAIPAKPPRFWQFKRKAIELRINNALRAAGLPSIDDYGRQMFWGNIRVGQDIREDAGGYIWRCWCAALRLHFPTPSMPYRAILNPQAEAKP